MTATLRPKKRTSSRTLLAAGRFPVCKAPQKVNATLLMIRMVLPSSASQPMARRDYRSSQKVSEDSVHNVYWRLFMDIGDSGETVELSPGASDGVLYDGMSGDGSKVFFTTKDQQLPSGSHSSAELYVAEVSEGGAALRLISTGTANACDPVESSERFTGTRFRQRPPAASSRSTAAA